MADKIDTHCFPSRHATIVASCSHNLLIIVFGISCARRFRLYDKVCTLALARGPFTNGFRAFDKHFYCGNSRRSYRGHTKIARMFARRFFPQHKANSEPFRTRVAYFSRSISRIQYKKSWNGGQIAVNLGTCQHFLILKGKDKVIKRCCSSIFKVPGGWDASVLSLYSSSSWRKKVSKISLLAN